MPTENMPVAILLTTEPISDQKIAEIKRRLAEYLAKDGVAVHGIQTRRFNDDHGPVVIYQP